MEYLNKRQEKIAGDDVTKAVRKVIMDALGNLPDVTDHAANKETVKAAVAEALKGWDKYATPKAGETGFDCSQNDADPPVRPKDACKDTVDADGKVTSRGCCSAVVPFSETPDFKTLTLATRKEVCLVSGVALASTVWEPVQFVELLEKKYSA